MNTENILQDCDGALLTITINRPEKANALTPEMLVQLRDAFRSAAERDDLRAMVITGGGGRVFCAGADLNTLHEDLQGQDLWVEMPEALRAVPVLTIAAINGPCMGGGLSLALHCDVRIAAPQAKFAYPVLRNNVLPGQDDVDKLCHLIGHGRASTILLGGKTISAKDAENWGLVDRLTRLENLRDEAKDLVSTAIASDGEHLRKLKFMLKGNAG